MSNRGYREASKIDWGKEEASGCTLEEINTGAILRIADATEKMAQRHIELIRDRDYWERRARRVEDALATERRRSASLRGHLKRAKSAAVKPDSVSRPSELLMQQREELLAIVQNLVSNADKYPFNPIGYFVEHCSNAREVLAKVKP